MQCPFRRIHLSPRSNLDDAPSTTLGIRDSVVLAPPGVAPSAAPTRRTLVVMPTPLDVPTNEIQRDISKRRMLSPILHGLVPRIFLYPKKMVTSR